MTNTITSQAEHGEAEDKEREREREREGQFSILNRVKNENTSGFLHGTLLFIFIKIIIYGEKTQTPHMTWVLEILRCTDRV